jgi:hypothetical protein
VTHQPAISFSNSFQFPFNRAGGRTSNVLQKKMHLLGMLTMIGGFLGIISFGVLGVTRSMPAALITHGVLFVTFVAFSIRRSGGLSGWLNMKVKDLYSVHYSIIILIGLAFVIGGVCIAALIEPGSQPNSMTKFDQIYFGIIFASIGGGLIPIAVADWMSCSLTRGRTRRPS